MVRHLREFYYITHIHNLLSIFQEGILSHAEVEQRGIRPITVYDENVVNWRKARVTPDGRSLWEYANLYLNARNPMLYRLLKKYDVTEIVVLGVRNTVLNTPGSFVTTGNAARSETEFLPSRKWRKRAKEILEGVDVEWWSEADGSKRRVMAEVLIPERVPPENIDTIYVGNDEAREKVKLAISKFSFDAAVKNRANKVRERILNLKDRIVVEPSMFFAPAHVYTITPKLRLIKGDMFFSNMQTLTISVNTVGVMGKGLASRAKYQFPDAYVVYQDACRKKAIRIGIPYLYKREASLDASLADDTVPMPPTDRRTWFLFFPTKRHWKERSRIWYIEAGLKWIVRHYREEGIESLALPALGCGLGGLDWADVGPLMCRYLSELEIDVEIYLPREHSVPDEQLEPEFLLGQKGR